MADDEPDIPPTGGEIYFPTFKMRRPIRDPLEWMTREWSNFDATVRGFAFDWLVRPDVGGNPEAAPPASRDGATRRQRQRHSSRRGARSTSPNPAPPRQPPQAPPPPLPPPPTPDDAPQADAAGAIAPDTNLAAGPPVIELLTRMDESLRRLRQLAEAAQPPLALFAPPEQ